MGSGLGGNSDLQDIVRKKDRDGGRRRRHLQGLLEPFQAFVPSLHGMNMEIIIWYPSLNKKSLSCITGMSTRMSMTTLKNVTFSR